MNEHYEIGHSVSEDSAAAAACDNLERNRVVRTLPYFLCNNI